MRVIFLDIDGVLNSERYDAHAPPAPEGEAPWGPSWIDPANVCALNAVVERTGARVVVSSTWRLNHSPDALQSILAARGFVGEIIAATPARYRTPEGRRLERGDEIQAWLDANPPVESFVILDDHGDMAHLGAHLVRTDPSVGLTPADAERAIALLAAR